MGRNSKEDIKKAMRISLLEGDIEKLNYDQKTAYILKNIQGMPYSKISQIMDLSPYGIKKKLSLNNPIYTKTAAYGHFGRKPTNKGEFTWVKTDKTELFNL